MVLVSLQIAGFISGGNCFNKIAGHYVKTDEDWVVDLQDITSSGFTYTSRIWLLVLTIIFGLLAIWGWLASEALQVGMAIGLICAICFGLYCVTKITMYTVTFGGGSLSVNTSWYSAEEVKEFDKALRLEKDSFLAAHLYKG